MIGKTSWVKWIGDVQIVFRVLYIIMYINYMTHIFLFCIYIT